MEINVGEIIIWTGDTKSSNKVRTGDVAVILKNNRFLALFGTGISKGEIFYESNKDYRPLTKKEEWELYFKM